MAENPTVAVYNDPSSGVADADAQAMAEAVAVQVTRDFEPVWHAGVDVQFVPSTSKPPATDWVVALLDNSDQAGALGYHDLTPAGLPLGKIFAGTDRQYGSSVSVTLSHEVLEMLADPWINLAAQAPSGEFYAWEVADAVEDDSLAYEIDGVKVSAFVTPHWFGSGSDDQNHLSSPSGLLRRPLELAAGGYISVFDPSSGKGWQQLQADHAPATGSIVGSRAHVSGRTLTPAEAAHGIPRVGSRRERRFRGRDAWIASTYETA